MLASEQSSDPLTDPAVSDLSFEAALKELEGIVRQLESGDLKLESAIGAYERGAALKQHCETKLKQAQAKIEVLSLDAAGTPSGTRPFEED